MANKLVGYDSGEDSENADDLSNNQSQFEHSTEQIEAAFASEWECFERLIAGPSNENPQAGSCIQPIQKSAQKRVFREEAASDNSDSDVSNESVGMDKPCELTHVKPDTKILSQRSRSSSVSPTQSMSANDSESDSSGDAPAAKKRSSVTKSDDQQKSDRATVEKSESMKPEVSGARRVSEEKKERGELACSGSKASHNEVGGRCESTEADNSSRKHTGATDGKSRDKRSTVAESRTSGSHGEHDRRPSGRKRSPSPRSNRRRDGHASSRRSRSRSRDRRHRSRSHSRERRHERRSRSRSADKHRSRHHHGHDRYPSPRSRRHGSRERRRSRTRSPPKQPANADKPIKNQPLNFKEQLKAQLVSAAQQQAATAAAAAEAAIGVVSPTTTQQIGTGTVADVAKMLEVRAMLKANEKPSNLPLVAGNTLAAGGKDRVTPQQALAQTMAAMHQKVQELTGVSVPSYYNIAAVNPLKYAEQLKKRKLLWSKAPKETNEGETSSQPNVRAVQSVAQWTGSSFAADSDGKQAEKFRKLMGIKEDDKMLLADNVDISKLTEEQRRRQDELFQQLDREYAFARMSTHTHRGVGLGFQSQGLPDP